MIDIWQKYRQKFGGTFFFVDHAVYNFPEGGAKQKWNISFSLGDKF